MPRRLTPKQQRFVEEYPIDLNAKQSAIRSGYSPKSAKEIGYENLTKPHILEGIMKALKERSERTEIDSDYVLRQAVKLHERCMQEIRPLTDGKGNHQQDDEGNYLFTFNASGALKALEIIGRHTQVKCFIDNRAKGDDDLPTVQTVVVDPGNVLERKCNNCGTLVHENVFKK